MPEFRSPTQRLQLALVNLVGALTLAFIAWKAAAWAIDFTSAASESGVPVTSTRIDTLPIAIFLVAGFAAILAVAALANAGYLAFRKHD